MQLQIIQLPGFLQVELLDMTLMETFLVLQLMDGGLGLGEIAREVTRRFPQVFRDENAALETIANLSEEFSS